MASIHHLPPATATSDLVVFGTYRLKGEVLEIALGQAIHAMTQHGIPSPLIDTALSYNNTEIIQSVLRKYPNIRIGSKVHRRNEVAADLEGEMAKYGSRLHRVLLHRYMPVESYLHLVKAKAEKKLVEIGISNYSVAQLRELVAALQELDKQGLLPLPFREAVPDVCQNEFHAFLKTSVPEACRDLGIRFEAHSIFSKLEEYPQDLRNPEARPTAGQVAMAYAVQRTHGGTVAFNTANYRHLIENLGLETVDEAVFAHLEAHVRDNSLAFAKYAGSDTAAFRPQLNCVEPAIGSGFDTMSADDIVNKLAPKLKIDLDLVKEGKVPASSTANGIPKLIVKNPQRRAAYLALADALVDPVATRPGKAAVAAGDNEVPPSAQALVIAEEAKMQKLEANLSKVRRALFEHALAMRKKAKPIMCRYRAVEDPEALPVDIPDPAVLQPFIDLIAETTALPETAIRMERGVLFPDGRMDFCKQVAQPSFEKLCAAVLKGGVVKHFLIGNNLALANDTTGSREAALASLIRDSKGIQTWYLAGNAISKDQIASIADGIASSADAKYVWLKMNPIQTGSYHLGRMLKRNPRIEVLDLFNTGQCDAGVAALLQGYDDASAEASPDSAPSGLKHLYLDINAITDGALVARLASRFPQLETLSVNVNQLRDAGVKALCDGLTAPMLQRLVLGSNGAKNESIDAIEDVVRRHPHLTILQLGSYKSTRFFRHQANSFTSYDRMLKLAATVAANARASSNPAMNYFGFQHCYWQSDASQLVLAVADLGLHANGVQWNSGGQTTITSKQLNELLGTPTNVQPAPEEYIQSVYRNNM